jgi:hypothetical protein
VVGEKDLGEAVDFLWRDIGGEAVEAREEEDREGCLGDLEALWGRKIAGGESEAAGSGGWVEFACRRWGAGFGRGRVGNRLRSGRTWLSSEKDRQAEKPDFSRQDPECQGAGGRFPPPFQ